MKERKEGVLSNSPAGRPLPFYQFAGSAARVFFPARHRLPELATERENALPANPVRTLAFWRSRHRKRFQVYLPHRPFELGDAPVSHAAVLLERAIEYRADTE